MTTPACVQGVGGDGGADDVDAVQGGLGVDLAGSAGDGQGGVGDGDLEVFGHLVGVDDLADSEADLVRAGQPAGGDRGVDGGQQGLGGGEQLVALAGPRGGEERVAAGDQAFAGVVGVADLGEVLLVEQGRLQRPAGGGERLDRRGPQRGQPAQVGLGPEVQVGNNVQINVTMQLGSITESVKVTATAGMVETRENSISQVIDEKRIVDLPLNGRQPTQLILLSGAAVTAPAVA